VENQSFDKAEAKCLYIRKQLNQALRLLLVLGLLKLTAGCCLNSIGA